MPGRPASAEAPRLSLVGVAGGFTDNGYPDHQPPYGGNLADHVGDLPDDVDRRRQRLLSELGAKRLCFIRQVHGARVSHPPPDLSDGVVRLAGDADALVSSTPLTALAVLVADCLPVLLADPQARVVAAAHSGRAGLLAGVLPATVEAMVAAGAASERITALVGPGICGGCYELSADLQQQVAAALPVAAASTRTGRPSVDLPAAAIGQLHDLGIADVRRDSRCTAESPELFSYRRDGVTGRFAGWVMLR